MVERAVPARQRLDKFLWFARIVKSRTLAQKLIEAGNVRLDGNRITQPAHKVDVGQVLTITYAERLRVLKVLDTGTRRGPAPEAQQLYQDLTPTLPKREKDFRPAPAAQREPGAGRPTKKERREIDAFRDRD